jgi:hypothetical protein
MEVKIMGSNHTDSREVREKLERLLYPDLHPEPPHPAQKMMHQWMTACQTLLQRLRCDVSAPVIWTYQTATGETLWNAYDPTSGWSIIGAQYTQVWAWLAERYRQRLKLQP